MKKKPKNIPSPYKSKGTPIYRDTTALPFDKGGNMENPPIQFPSTFPFNYNYNFLNPNYKVVNENPNAGTESWFNPMNWFVPRMDQETTFNSAFEKAKRSGYSEFIYNGKRYNTKSNMTPAQQMKVYGITDEQRITDPWQPRKNLSTMNTEEGYSGGAEIAFNRMLGNSPSLNFSPNEANTPGAKEQDAFKLYLGLPQSYNTFQPSKYKKGALELTGYNALLPDTMPSDKELQKYGVPKYSETWGNQKNPLKPYDDYVMGRHTVKKGKDSRGEYIEYIDKWDLDTYKYNIDNRLFNAEVPVGSMADMLNKPFDIYGRKYYKDYGDGVKKTMYYSDQELQSFDPKNKNFDTLALQKELANRGYKFPKSTTKSGEFDGVYGEETKKALQDWQSKNFQPGETYTFSGRPGSYYKYTEEGNMLIKNKNTGGKYIPMTDEDGKRLKTLQAGLATGKTKKFLDGGPLVDKTNHGNLLPSVYASALGNYYADGGYVVKKSNDRKGKTHVVIGPDGTKKYFGDPKMGERGNSEHGKEAFYARHAKNLENNPYFRAYAKATWKNGGFLNTKYFKDGGPQPIKGSMQTYASKDGTVTNKFVNTEGNTVIQVKTPDGKYYEKILPTTSYGLVSPKAQEGPVGYAAAPRPSGFIPPKTVAQVEKEELAKGMGPTREAAEKITQAGEVRKAYDIQTAEMQAEREAQLQNEKMERQVAASGYGPSEAAQPVDWLWTLPIGASRAGINAAYGLGESAAQALGTNISIPALGYVGPTYGSALNAGFMGYGAYQLPETGKSWYDAYQSGTGDYRNAIGKTAWNALDFLGVGEALSGLKSVSPLTKFTQTAELPVAENIMRTAEQTQPTWTAQDMPGLHLKSTMSNGPISKIVEPKTGLINVEQALGIIGKEAAGADKVAIIKKGLGETIPKKMNFNDFRKVVQDQLVPLERKFATHRSDYGLKRINYSTGDRKTILEDIDYLTERNKLFSEEISQYTNYVNNPQQYRIDNPGGSVNLSDKELIEMLQSRLENSFRKFYDTTDAIQSQQNYLNDLPLENKTLILSNKDKLGIGSSVHKNPEETLGHIHFLRNAETPDVLTVTQIQSDAFQGTHRIMPNRAGTNSDIAKAKLEIEEVKSRLTPEKKAEMLNTYGEDATNFTISQLEEILLNAETKLKQAEDLALGPNPIQKKLIDANHQERYLQELVNYSAERGDISKIQLPTSETAAKVQGYKKHTLDEFRESLAKAKPEEIAEVEKKYPKFIQDIKEGNFTEDYDPGSITILKKYSDLPKNIKKLFGVEPKVVTDSKGNTWYEFDIPESFKQGKGEIQAFKKGGYLYGKGGQFPTPYSLPEDSFKQGGDNLHNSIYASSMAQYPAVYKYGGSFDMPRQQMYMPLDNVERYGGRQQNIYKQGGSVFYATNTPQLEGEGKDLTYPDRAYVYNNGGVIKTSHLFADGGPTDPPWKKYGKLTYKNNADIINGIADFNTISKVYISPEYNDQIKHRLYTGNYGFDPATGVLYKLNTSERGQISKEDKNILQSQKNSQIKKEQEAEYLNSVIQAGYDPVTFGGGYLPKSEEYSKFFKQSGPRNFEQLKHSDPATWSDEEKKIWSREGHMAVINNPLFQAAAMFTPEGAAIAAIHGLTSLAPDLYNKEYSKAVFDAAQVLPFMSSAKNIVKGIAPKYAAGFSKLKPGLNTVKQNSILLNKKLVETAGELPNNLLNRRLEEFTKVRRNTGKPLINSTKELETILKTDLYRVNKLKKQYPELDFNDPNIEGFMFTDKNRIERIPELLKGIQQNRKSGESFGNYIMKDYNTKMNFVKNSGNKALINVIDESPQYLDEVYAHLKNPKGTDANFLNDLTVKSNTYTRFMGKDHFDNPDRYRLIAGKNIDNSGYSMDVEGVYPSDYYGSYGYRIQPSIERMREIVNAPLEQKWSLRQPTFQSDIKMVPGMHTGFPKHVKDYLKLREQRLDRMMPGEQQYMNWMKDAPMETYPLHTLRENLPATFLESKYFKVPQHQVFNTKNIGTKLKNFDVFPLGKLDVPENTGFNTYDYNKFFEGTGKGFKQGGKLKAIKSSQLIK